MEHSIIPPCEATGPDGTRLLVRPHASTDSVGDLARALDLAPTTPLAIDARPVAPHERLVAAGLRVGSAVTIVPSAPAVGASAVPSDAPAGAAGAAVVDIAVLAGPACTGWVTLGAGRHSVGRSVSAAIRVEDPSVELHHGVFDVGTDGSVTFAQLTGAVPATVDGVPCGRVHRVDAGSLVSLGVSRLAIRNHQPAAGPTSLVGGSIVALDRDPWRSVVRRGPAAPDQPFGEQLEVPQAPGTHRAPPLTSLVGAGVAAAGAGLLAAVLGQLLFAVFAGVGAVAAVATWAVGALVARRDRRRANAAHHTERQVFESALSDAHADAERRHRSQHRDVVDALEAVHGSAGVWSRRCGPSDALWATVGRGTCRWTPPIADDTGGRLDADLLVSLEQCERLVDVAVPLALESSSVVAFSGVPVHVAALARSVIVQLAATYGPADWQLQVITSEPGRWDWTSWLPHARGSGCVVAADDPAAVAAAIDRTCGGGDARRTLVVLDVVSLLSARTGPVRRRLERGGATCLALVAPGASVPAIVDRTLEVGALGGARWIHSGETAWTSLDRDITVAGLSESVAATAARRLAPLIDPEDHDETGGIPTAVSLAELEPVADDAANVIARRWKQSGRDPAPIARLGLADDGVVDIDLVRDGPHGLIAGTTGSGKSELLRTLVVSLAARCSPDHVTMILVDFKGGSTFDVCAKLPHTVGVVTDLDDGLAERVLVSLDAEIRRRERLLRDAHVDDLTGYRRMVDEPLPRLVVVIDEFASLAKELPDFLGALVAIAQRGRSLGIHLLLATQRPAGVVTDDIRANTNLRVALRLQDRADSVDVVGDEAPARFPPGIPGRAALRLGPDELVLFQTASTNGVLPSRTARLRVEPIERTDPAIDDEALGPPADAPSVLEHLVDAISGAAAVAGIMRPHRPWIDSLPEVIDPCEIDADGGAIGVLDDPAGQCRRPLAWTAAAGSLLLVGAVGSGTTTAASAVVAACARASPPASLHVYVVDAQGDAVWSTFEPLAHCGAVIRLTEGERLNRLLVRLTDELDRRATDGRRVPTVVVAIDGYAVLRDTLDAVVHGEAAMRLDRLVRDGPAVGIVAVVTTDGSSSRGLAVPRSATWVFHVADQGVARTVGLRGAVIPPDRPGRMRVVESGLEGHVALDQDLVRGVDRQQQGGGPAPVLVLPEVVDADDLDARAPIEPARPNGQPVSLPIGLDGDDLEPAMLRVPVGDHVFIGGAARTGRSTALRQVEAQWRRAHPGGRVVRLGRQQMIGGGLLDDRCDNAPLLVVVDDAERVDDPDGALGRQVAAPGVTFAIAARLEAVRVAYGHWTREVTRSRCGLIMTSMGDIDGELLGVTLPRRSSVPARPGLAWLVDQGGHRLVQVAARMAP
jgi:S-DNA-T family DNA segregation ATPase FtsK/SpoIIIE